jgi:hypothetical protein
MVSRFSLISRLTPFPAKIQAQTYAPCDSFLVSRKNYVLIAWRKNKGASHVQQISSLRLVIVWQTACTVIGE